MKTFTLDPRLAKDCIDIGALPLCRLLLMNDSRYPWCVLVPQRAEVRELHELARADQLQLLEETTALAAWLEREFGAHKMNVAALGNVVSQLHVHVIVRYRSDDAWPAPVWGRHSPLPYSGEQLAALRVRLRAGLAHGFGADAP